MPETSGFVAYPSDPRTIGDTIEAAAEVLRSTSGPGRVHTWKENNVAGRFIAEQVLDQIDQRDCLIADITRFNFNVVYEIGFAIGRRKKLLLIRNSSISPDNTDITELGIFDTLGYKTYSNSSELADLFRGINEVRLLQTSNAPLNQKAPVYLIESRYRTDVSNRIIARVKKARLFFRSFDPNERPRLSAYDAIRNVAESYGVLVHLLEHDAADEKIHNLRAAFIAGLAAGMGKAQLILQHGSYPVPIDYRDLVVSFQHPTEIDEAIGEFSTRVTEALQAGVETTVRAGATFLETLNLGASAAENELRDLSAYYLEIDAFKRALRGEARIIVGRKGSGKTAIFAQVRDRVRGHKKNIVLDLKPDGYKLLKFKEDVLKLLEKGTLEHTIAAFWEYLLLLEICYKILEKDRTPHTHDTRLYDGYRRLAELYQTDEYVSEGDFSERMSKLIQTITDHYQARYAEAPSPRLSQAQVTELLYRHDVPKLRQEIIDYLKFKDSLWLLFDNLDKGWPTHGIQPEDLIIIRTLLDATRNIERQLQKRDIDAHALAFLRNDVYELLVRETPDRGKEARVVLDWTDSDLLRELLRRRIVYNNIPQETPFDHVWRSMCISHIDGEESSQYFIERCLMRPRCLIDLINHCRSYAVNLHHDKIEVEDIGKGLAAYSTDLIFEISLEIRDIFPQAENVLYAFIGCPQKMGKDALEAMLKTVVNADVITRIIDILLWYGVLGVVRSNGEVAYVYSVNYDMNHLKAIIGKLDGGGLVFSINPAFWSGLEVS